MEELQMEQISCSPRAAIGKLSGQKANQFEHVCNIQRGELSGLSITSQPGSPTAQVIAATAQVRRRKWKLFTSRFRYRISYFKNPTETRRFWLSPGSLVYCWLLGWVLWCKSPFPVRVHLGEPIAFISQKDSNKSPMTPPGIEIKLGRDQEHGNALYGEHGWKGRGIWLIWVRRHSAYSVRTLRDKAGERWKVAGKCTKC